MTARRPAGFTLVEVITVIAIVAILAALVAGIASFVIDKGRRETAKTQIKTIEALLQTYYADQGGYPMQGNGSVGNSTAALIDALYPLTPGAKIYPIPLRMFDSYRAGLDEAAIRANAHFLVDPFGNPYHYQYEGDPNRSGKIAYDLWSQGSRNSTDPQLWIKNW